VSDSTARIFALLDLLQSSDVRTVGELADRLGVDERTVRRYVQKLVDLDIPVESLRGRYGGYRLARGFRMPPVMLSDDEAVAVVLGLIHAQASSAAAGLEAQTALAKLRRSLPAETARRVDALLATATFDTGHPQIEIPDAGMVLTVAEAIHLRQPLDLRYHDARGVPSRRAIQPYDLVARAGRWYLIGFDVDRGAERVFRVDRIDTARALSGTFTPPERSAAEARLVDGIATAERRWRVVLRIRASQEHIRSQLPETIAVLTPIGPVGATPWHRAEIQAERLDWLPGVILALDCEVIVDGPERLRQAIRASAARLLRTAAATTPTIDGVATRSGPAGGIR